MHPEIAPGTIHASAIIDESAQLAPDVSVAPYCVIGPNVVIGAGTQVGAHVVIERDTTIGMQCRLHAGAVLGGDPQDLAFKSEVKSRVAGGLATTADEKAAAYYVAEAQVWVADAGGNP